MRSAIKSPACARKAVRFMAVLMWFMLAIARPATGTTEPLVIAASPSLQAVLEGLSVGFEASHPDVRVKLYFESGLDLRRTIAGMENSMVGQYFIGRGPIHLVAPGGDELIARLQQKYYVLPDAKRPYAFDQLVLVVPESLVEAPDSLEALGRGRGRLAVADPVQTRLGQQVRDALRALGLETSLKGRLDVATDSNGVIDHVLSGQADAGDVGALGELDPPVGRAVAALAA